jgi:hypothetical protein
MEKKWHMVRVSEDAWTAWKLIARMLSKELQTNISVAKAIEIMAGRTSSVDKM